MESYYRELAQRDAQRVESENRSSEEIRQAAIDDLSQPYRPSNMPNALPYEIEMQLRASNSSNAFKIDSSNVGHRMLVRMGWEEGTGLGKKRSGRLDPVEAQKRRAGVGIGADTKSSATATDQIQEGDDEFTVFQKRKMMAYKNRPNPLNNPRRAYY